MKRYIKIFSLTLLAAAFFGYELSAQPDLAFKCGEKLTFMVSYRARLVPNTDVAKVDMSVQQSSYDSKSALLITGTGNVMPFFKWFFDLHDTYRTWLDPQTMRPLYSTCDIREGGYKFSSRFTFDWEQNRVNTAYRNLKRADDIHKTMHLKEGSYDGLALFYNLRSSVIDESKRGRTQHMNLVLEDTIRRIDYKFLGREILKVKDLGKFHTLKFSCQLATTTEISFEDGTEFFLWVSDDKNRIPLYIESPIRVGSIQARLIQYENLKYKLDSKIK